MLAIGFGEALIGVLIILISLLLIGLVLLQKNRGSGLSGAFGGVGGHSAFGTKTGDFLTWFTVGLASLFLILCIAGNFMFEPARPKTRTPANVTNNESSNTDDAGTTGTPADGAADDSDSGAGDSSNETSEPESSN
ncbi:MAG: preprotein translocase subunit SecG [Phycisphaerales bacterium]|nr:preprotein translocase subunit SecG [Phycisphaerales bacterium]